MNILFYCSIIILVLFIYIYKLSSSSTNKIKSEEDQREIPPTILEKPVIENELYYTETREDREKLFIKSYISFKTKHKEKINDNERVFERRVNEIQESNTKKIQAIEIIDKALNKKKLLGSALKKLAISTGNDE